MAEEETPQAVSEATDEQSDWMKGLGGQEEETPEAVSEAIDQPDWLKGFGSESEAEMPAVSTTGQPDWLDQPEQEKDVQGILPSEGPSNNNMDNLDEATSEPEEQSQPTLYLPQRRITWVQANRKSTMHFHGLKGSLQNKVQQKVY